MQNFPVAGTSKTDNNEQAVNTSASRKKKTIYVVEKRSDVQQAAKSGPTKITARTNKKTVSRPIDPMEKVVRPLPIDEFRSTTKSSVQQSRGPVAAVTDKPTIKKSRQDVNKQLRNESSAQATTEVSSASLDETSVPSSSGGSSESANRCFWNESLASDFDSPTYKMGLLSSGFTEQQATIVQQSFYQLSQKLFDTHNAPTMKTYKCIQCKFSISHQCMSIQFTQGMPLSSDAAQPTRMVPDSTMTCDCQFAFFHSHATSSRLRSQPVDNSSAKNTSSIIEHYRSVTFGCGMCHIYIVMENRRKNICCEMEKWNSTDGANRTQFHKSVQKFLQHSTTGSLKLDELFTCRQHCCLLFHRCNRTARVDNTMPIQPLRRQ
ncbi:d7.1 [Tranosema rostrale ichnovirus]|nr:d7.1 [Tranosema rostrale ichnovirus]